jgi:hypothetical protein
VELFFQLEPFSYQICGSDHGSSQLVSPHIESGQLGATAEDCIHEMTQKQL